MLAFFLQYYWVPGVAFLILCVIRCEQRAYGLAGAGRLSSPEAARLTRLAWLSVVAISSGMMIAQFTYTGARGACALLADPFRPGALLAWVLLGAVVLRIGTLAVTPAGIAFLTRAWPAVNVSAPLSRVWRPREVVRSVLTGIGLIVLIYGGMIWMAIARPGSVMRC